MADIHLLWDASGLVKRYYLETGQAAVNEIFSIVPTQEMGVTAWGYAETYSILLRRSNSGALTPSAFRAAKSKLQSEILGDADFEVLSITDTLIFSSLSLMEAHNINSADAAILSTYLQFQRASRVPCLLVASDKRLLRAAEAEGLSVLNPEEVTPVEVAGLLAKS